MLFIIAEIRMLQNLRYHTNEFYKEHIKFVNFLVTSFNIC